MKHTSKFDVIVVGGGHAGIEAAVMSSRLGAKTAIVTFDKKDIGTLSCNPAMGGLGKGHLIKEIDAMGGIIGKASDLSGIQFRVLNKTRGEAVQGPRAQIDRDKYKAVSTSFGVRNAVDQADKRMKQWKVTGVPTLIVNGKYKVSASTAVRTDQLFDVVDFLVEKERN